MLRQLLLGTSLIVAPMYLGDAPPELRSARTIVIAPPGGKSAPVGEAERARAEALLERLRKGEDFELLVRECSSGPTAETRGIMGTYPPGILAPALDRFLFEAPIGAISEPLESPAGLQIVQRIEKDAGCLAILCAGADGEQRARALLAELAGGADFAALAREHSDDEASAARGGQYRIFERGPQDQLLKAAVFDLAVGATGGPLETPLGWFVYRRVEPRSIEPALADVNVGRVRAILVAWRGARGAEPSVERTQAEALELAKSLLARIEAGEDMAALAREHDDDQGGRERAGDLGWLVRGSPQAPKVLDGVFLVPRGKCAGPLGSTAGWVLARRER